MNNKLILDLTVQLTQALDQNYDVVNMDTVLAVISALEGATITKEQLETTRLAKHINQLRRRNKSNILAIRAKNLLKQWREMVGITSQAQSEGPSSAPQQTQAGQQQIPKPILSSASQQQPASPYSSQLLGENFDNSLSSIGGGVEFSRTSIGGSVNTGSANFIFNKKSTTGAIGEGSGAIISSRSNGALTDSQMRLMKSSNRSMTNNNSSSLPVTIPKVKHPTSFKNLISGFNTNSNGPKQSHSPALSPLSKAIPASSVIGGDAEDGKNNTTTTYIIDDDNNPLQTPASITGVAPTVASSPHIQKSTKRKERDSPVVMTFIEQSNSPIAFENISHEPGRASQTTRNNKINQIVTSTIDLHDSNSNSNFANALCEVTDLDIGNSARSVLNTNSKRTGRKDKKRPTDRINLITDSGNFQPTIDESSRIAFPISGIQEYLSLSNSSMSLFPSQKTAGSGEVDRYTTIVGSNDDNQPLNSSTERNNEVLDGDLTFAGKFKQSNGAGTIQVGTDSNYFPNGEQTILATSGDFQCGNMKVAMNNCRESISTAGTASTSTFHQFSRNSSDSNSDSRTSQLDLIDVVNQDSQSMITVDDLRHQQQSSNEKNKAQKDAECVQEQQQPKFVKENSNALKQYSKEQQRSSVTMQKPINISSQPSTPTSVVNLTETNTVPATQVEQKIPKKRGRKKGSKGVDSVLAQSAGLNSQFLMGPALGSNKKVKTTMELLADIQNRKLGSATSSPTLTNWFGTSRPASSCSELSLHSPRTSDACSTNATMSTAARSTPDKNISNNSVAVDELYESDSDTNTSEPSRDSAKLSIRNALTKNSKPIRNEGEVNTCVSTSSIEEKIKELMALLPPINVDNIDWVSEEEIPCTCSLEEIPPEVEVEVEANDENGFGLLENVDNIKSKDNFARQEDEKPIICVNILPLPTQTKKQLQPKLWSSQAPHSQSAPVSAITSPNVPSTNQKPIKSIFDLDFDDDNDPLHSFVEAATKNQKQQENSTLTENGKIINIDKQSKQNTTAQIKNHSEMNKTQQTSAQFESDQQISSVQSLSQQLTQPQLDNNEPTIPVLTNFPTYKVIEDPACQAKQRYETQTNQITQFHITAFHNCFIPNVNGNWDHSMPQIPYDDCQHLENKNIYANVVPKYGCFVTDRIPKDLSHVKFTKDFKPKLTKKSDKPPQPFLGVANIHGRHHIRMRYHQRLKKKSALKKKLKSHKTHALQESNVKIEHENTDQKPLSVNSYFNIPEPSATIESIEPIEVKKECDSHGMLIKEELPLTKDTSTYRENQLNAPDKKLENKHNNLDQYPSTIIYNNNNDLGTSNIDDFIKNIESEPSNVKTSITNGYNPNLTNNNSIIHCSNQSKGDVFAATKLTLKTNANALNENTEDDLMAASRRSSSCSNSSLKQNQNSINMKLRKHRLEQQQRRKRKHIASITDVNEAHTDESVSEHRVPSLIKRFKLVNGQYASTKGLINNVSDNNCLYDDGDSDCHIQSENDMITEEEIDEDCDDQILREGDEDEDYDENADDYDEDGDDEEDIEGPYGDFHEVVTRDMTSSTTGNNHIVLTIKKTPSKTNSPSSSSMSPAPVNVNTKITSNSSAPQSTNDVFLLEDNSNEFIESIQSDANGHRETPIKIEIGKNLEINPIKVTDLIDKTDFLMVEPTNIATYSFQAKKESQKDGSDNDDDNDESNQTTHINETGDHKDDDKANSRKLDSKDSKKITKTELFKSIQETKKHLRHQELKKRLKTGIDEAQKLHRKLFFPYELHTSIGSKILDISSCSSDCTDTSDSEGNNGSDTETSTSTSSGSGIDGTKSLLLLKRRRKSKVTPKKKKAVQSATGGGGGGGGGGGDDDPSSSSSSSSSSNSSSRSSKSCSTWTSSTSSSSSSSDDEKEDSELKTPPAAIKAEKQTDETKSSSINNEDTTNTLPSENNYLLKSFNHIYVSTEERRRQQQLKQTIEYSNNGIVNSDYITLSGDTSKQQQQLQQQTPSQSAKPIGLSDNCNVYNKYYLCSNSNNSNYIMTGGNKLTNTNSSIADSSSGIIKTDSSGGSSSVEGTNNIDSNYRINSVSSIGSNKINNNSSISLAENQNQMENENKNEKEHEHNHETARAANANPNPNASADVNANADINKNENENDHKNNNEKDNEHANTEPDLVVQDEYRTGLRKVDEDVDDEDGNNCARTQQFKEWHEVLQLRSYNDELLTVLPYVVIE